MPMEVVFFNLSMRNRCLAFNLNWLKDDTTSCNVSVKNDSKVWNDLLWLIKKKSFQNSKSCLSVSHKFSANQITASPCSVNSDSIHEQRNVQIIQEILRFLSLIFEKKLWHSFTVCTVSREFPSTALVPETDTQKPLHFIQFRFFLSIYVSFIWFTCS